jgi:hypothetical protein
VQDLLCRQALMTLSWTERTHGLVKFDVTELSRLLSFLRYSSAPAVSITLTLTLITQKLNSVSNKMLLIFGFRRRPATNVASYPTLLQTLHLSTSKFKDQLNMIHHDLMIIIISSSIVLVRTVAASHGRFRNLFKHFLGLL